MCYAEPLEALWANEELVRRYLAARVPGCAPRLAPSSLLLWAGLDAAGLSGGKHGPQAAPPLESMLKIAGRSIAHGGLPALAGVSVDRRALRRLPSHVWARFRISHVLDRQEPFPSLTVLEKNLEMGPYRPLAHPRREGLDSVLAPFPIRGERRELLAGSLSGGEQKMLALARSRMAQSEMLPLNEPSWGLGPRIVEGIVEAIAARRKSRWITILLVDQRGVKIVELWDCGNVSETGRVVLGERETLLVQHAYLEA